MVDVQSAFYRVAPHIVDLSVSDDGEIGFAGRRFVFFHTKMFATLFEHMADVAGPVVHGRVEAFGEKAGRQIASKLDDEFRSAGLLDAARLLVRSGFDVAAVRALRQNDTLSQIQKIFGLGTFDGWVGTVAVDDYVEGERLAVTAENTFESYSYGAGDDADQPRCRFLRGVLAGIVGYYWDVDDVAVEEETCRAAGSDACRMVVTHGA